MHVVGGIGVIEPRCELGLAQEALHVGVASAQLPVEDLDDCFTAQRWLFAAIHRAEPAFVEQLAKDEPSNFSPAKIVFACHPATQGNTGDQQIARARLEDWPEPALCLEASVDLTCECFARSCPQ